VFLETGDIAMPARRKRRIVFDRHIMTGKHDEKLVTVKSRFVVLSSARGGTGRHGDCGTNPVFKSRVGQSYPIINLKASRALQPPAVGTVGSVTS
jgi:hypothetical protein